MATQRVKRVTMTLEDGKTVSIEPTDCFYRVGTNGPAGTSTKHDYFQHEVRWTTPIPSLDEAGD